MNTKNLKAYAPKARSQFIEAIKKRAAQFGIYEGENGEVRIEAVQIEGSVAIIEGRAFTRQEGEQRKRLEKKVAERGYDMFIREMAYTWFNRLAAIRYMELHGYFDHGFRVLSHPSSVDSLPEILSHASDVADGLKLDKSHIIELQLAGDKEEQLYRELLLGQCHQLANIMPFVFKGLTADSIDDAAELLLPDNLTKTDSILKGLITDIPEEDWRDIEVIGWLYQFYISEHKDAVIGKVVKSEDIPAATQLFTPNWIVKYLVQNSVGRQWLATYPDSELKGKMEYYIESAEQSDEVIEQLKAITPTSIDPEQIKVLDPACGSGHILVEVYEVLREIYLERGYRLREIPELILTKNIYGLDIDDRAAQLAGFALMMKAREDDRRIFQRVEEGEVSLNVYSLQSTEHLDIPKLWQALDLEGNQQTGSTGGLFDTAEEFLQPTGIYKNYFELITELKSAFSQAKTLGSLIQIDNKYRQNLVALKELLQTKEKGSDPSAKGAAIDLLPIVNQALSLANLYDVIVANPPYMGSKYQNKTVKDYLKLNYKGYEKDLFSSFIVKCGELTKEHGKLGFMSPNVWMYISTHQKLRHWLLDNNYLSSLIELPLGGFKGATVQICAFTLEKVQMSNLNGSYIRLVGNKGGDEEMSLLTKSIIQTKEEGSYFEKSSNSFQLIPSSPIAYYLDEQLVNTFSNHNNLGSISHSFQGIITGDNEYYLRGWQEIDSTYMKLDTDPHDEFNREYWLPYAKGGAYRKWFGNGEYLIRWDGAGNDMTRSRGENKNYYYLEGTAWSDVTSGKSSFRYTPSGGLFDAAGPIAFLTNTDVNIFGLIGYLNSQYVADISKVLNPTIHFQSENYKSLPYIYEVIQDKAFINNSHQCVEISENDWDQFELSWHFKANPLIKINFDNIKQCFEEYNENCVNVTQRMLKLELDNETIFINKLGFSQANIKPVKLEDICLLANPTYRYGSKSSKEEQRQKFQSDTFIELLSYSIGCAMGRYSLDREGVVYAHSGNEGFKELVAEDAYQTFPADDDGIIPLASEEWLFDDDATTRFKEFVKTVWGEEHLTENLEFVADSLCLHALKSKKGEGANDTVRRYFSTQFFKDHCKTYKKRPIYWLFSSGKEKAFECLVYLHRYNEGTLSRMRTEYVTPLMGKFDAQHTLLSEQQIQASGTEARRIEKELKTLDKKQAELRTFDEQLKHYAEKRITLDLDDGVKANYGKFGNLLADVKAIHGKAVK